MISAKEQALKNLGDGVGAVIFAEEIDRQLSVCLEAAKRSNEEVELVYEASNPRLLAIPFEAARLKDGRVPALLPGVFAWRSRPLLKEFIFPLPPIPGGPLNVLVAIGAPDEDKTDNSVLDGERELETILNALERPRLLGNAHVKVLEVGSPEQIGDALRECSYHVLHLPVMGREVYWNLRMKMERPFL